MEDAKLQQKHRRISSIFALDKIHLAPPGGANLVMAGFVMFWMLSYHVAQ